jgi:hypothetical protein
MAADTDARARGGLLEQIMANSYWLMAIRSPSVFIFAASHKPQP